VLVAEIRLVGTRADECLAQLVRRVKSSVSTIEIAEGVRHASAGYRLDKLVSANLKGAHDGVAESIGQALLRLGAVRRPKGEVPAWSGRFRYSLEPVAYTTDELNELWSRYVGLIDEGSRFFNDGAREFLKGLFGAVHRLSMNAFFGPTQPIQDQRVGVIYRARSAKRSADVDRILAKPDVELSAPPPTSARAGRMNPERVAVFYGAFDDSTAIAELRPSIGEQVVVGQFKVVRPLKVLDMLILDRAGGATFSIWDPKFKERAAMRALLHRLHERVRRPIVAGAEHEYLATQVLADYLAVHMGVDAVIFGSAQNADGRNIVLLSHVLGRFDTQHGEFVSSPLEFVAGSARLVNVKSVKYSWQPAPRRQK
jgi:hypothetical protein